jgi:protein-disulfide isomerase
MNRKTVFITSAIALVLAFAAGGLAYRSEAARSTQAANPALARAHAPTTGVAAARVHIVEFIDPACGTCAEFYPHVKQLMQANPDKVRLTIRHVPFHEGSDFVVAALEASRKQGKYWEVLDALLARQSQWVFDHRVQSDRAWWVIASTGVNLEKLRSDMSAPEVTDRITEDLVDAKDLKVTKTPEYFVNGRPLPRFGLRELQDLVGEEVRRSY